MVSAILYLSSEVPYDKVCILESVVCGCLLNKSSFDLSLSNIIC